MKNKEKQLRDCLGLFSTGVLIACAKKKDFFAKTFFAEKILEDKGFIKRFDNFWCSFLEENVVGQKLRKALKIENTKDSQLYNSNFLKNIRKIFADEFFGMTINSFSSLSLDPPLILFSIDNKSSNLKLFIKNEYFSLNILGESQKDLSNAFATPRNQNKWDIEPFFFGKYGNPIFQNSLAFIECKKYRIIKAGDHHIVIGQIVDYGKISKQYPLIYYKGKYDSLAKDS